MDLDKEENRKKNSGEISQKYLCILEGNRGEEGCKSAQVEWRRTHVSQRS